MGFSCSAPGCLACAFVCASKEEPQKLSVRFSGAHSHAALPCAAHRAASCAECPAYNLLPAAEPFGSLSGLYGAVALSAATAKLLGKDSGFVDSATALFRATAALHPAAELLCDNRDRSGTDDSNLSALLSLERERIEDRAGGASRVSADLEEADDSLGLAVAKLVRAPGPVGRARRALTSPQAALQESMKEVNAPLMGRIMSIEVTPRGLSVAVSSHMRAVVGGQLLAEGEVLYADATGGLTSKRDGKARGAAMLRRARHRG